MSRQYTVDFLFWAECPEMKKIFESAEYKSKNSFYSVKADAYTRATLYTDRHIERSIEITDSRLVEELVSCMEKDFRAMSFEDLISLRPSYVNIEVQYTYTQEGVIGGKGQTGYMSFNVPLDGENTINWLKAHGYNFDLTAEMVEKIDIYAPESQDAGDGERVETIWTKDAGYMDKVPMLTVTDKEKIGKILQNYHTASIDYSNSYEIRIYYTPTFDGSMR